MKMSKILAFVLVAVMLVSCCAGLVGCKKTETITIWVSEVDGAADLARTQVDRFLAAHPEYDYEIVIEGVSEADAATNVLTDVNEAADIYCFAQDQLARLVQASALAAPAGNAATTVKNDNDAISVSAASVGGTLYAYPLTSDNGYFLFYDKSIVKDPTSMEAILADCAAADKKFGFEVEGSGWYTASFFFGTGCRSDWTTNEEGDFTGVNDTFSDEVRGFAAIKGLSYLTQHSAYVNASKIVDGIGAVVSGTWISKDAATYFGDNFGVTKLPSFTVDGTSYQLGSFSGNKLMGVKPQEDADRAAFCSELALYLTNTECQLERYETLGWGPSNKAAQSNEAVKADAALGALAAQGAHAIPQGQIHGKWWDIATALAASSRTCTTDEELKRALATYKASIDSLFAE